MKRRQLLMQCTIFKMDGVIVFPMSNDSDKLVLSKLLTQFLFPSKQSVSYKERLEYL